MNHSHVHPLEKKISVILSDMPKDINIKVESFFLYLYVAIIRNLNLIKKRNIFKVPTKTYNYAKITRKVQGLCEQNFRIFRCTWKHHTHILLTVQDNIPGHEDLCCTESK